MTVNKGTSKGELEHAEGFGQLDYKYTTKIRGGGTRDLWQVVEILGRWSKWTISEAVGTK
jgi:hypothetical protein